MNNPVIFKDNHECIITGGTGFIAHWLGNKSPIKGYYFSHSIYQQNWTAQNIKYFIHLAPVPIDRVLECAKRCNATVLLASSGGVYDKEPSDYMKMKLEDERKLLESGLDVKIARIFTTCGAHMDWERYAIGKFIKAALAGEPILVNEDAARSYMYGSDLAEWLWKILLKGLGGIYNVGSWKLFTLRYVANEIKRITGSKSPIVLGCNPFDPHPYYVPDTSRARDELGLTIKVPFEEAIAKTIEDYKNECQ